MSRVLLGLDAHELTPGRRILLAERWTNPAHRALYTAALSAVLDYTPDSTARTLAKRLYVSGIITHHRERFRDMPEILQLAENVAAAA